MKLLTLPDDHCNIAYLGFQNYRRDGKFCDVTIDVGKEKFPVHKVVLSASSSYFNNLFQDENYENVQNEISIEGVTESAANTCLKFIYHEKFDIKMDEVGDLLHAACLFQLKSLKQRCIVMLQNNIGVSNCVEIYKLSQAYECDDIENKAKTMMLKNAEKLFQDDKFVADLDANTLKMMVKSEDLLVSDEAVIFEALLKWISVDEKERQDYFCDILEFIRLPTADKDYFTDVIWTNNHIQNTCKKCKEYATDCLLHITDMKMHGLKDYQLRKRKLVQACHQHEMVVVSQRYDSVVSISKFDTESSSFRNFIPKKQIKIKARPQLYCLHGGFIYVFDIRNSRSMFRYEDRKWKKLSCSTYMKYVSNNAHLLSYDSFILVIDTWNNTKVHCFNAIENKWMRFPSLNERHWCSSCIVYRNRVYVTGGLNNDQLSSSVERFDSVTKKWQMMPRMNQARRDHASAVYQDKIFVAGGWYGSKRLTSVETFHEGDNTWTSIQSLNIKRSHLSLFVNDNKLYAFGGVREDGYSLYETFDAKGNSWKESNPKNNRVILCKVFVK